MLRAAIQKAVSGAHLSRDEASAALDAIFGGQVSAAQLAAFLVALRMKGETPDEIAGAALALRKRMIAVPVREELRAKLIDTCGTGGDGAHTFNLSTAAAFVAAAGGAIVAKHGNRAISSKCGSADVLAALGVELELSPESLSRALESCGIAFLFAPRHHAAMRTVAPIRQELGMRTLFNLLGPLANPAGASRQLLGVYARELAPIVARTLAELGAERALVVHGHGGLDELSIEGPTLAIELTRDASGAKLLEREITPEALGLARGSIDELRGGDADENAALLIRALSGEKSARRTAVLLNAGAALWVAGAVDDLRAGVARAAGLIDSGAAMERVERLVRVTRELKQSEAK